jgi:hypothetical protein
MVSAEILARLKWLAVALAGLAAGAYVLIGNHILGVGDLAPAKSQPRSFMRPPAAIWWAGCSFCCAGAGCGSSGPV